MDPFEFFRQAIAYACTDDCDSIAVKPEKMDFFTINGSVFDDAAYALGVRGLIVTKEELKTLVEKANEALASSNL